MEKDKELAELFLKEQLIEYALKYRDKKTFNLMTSFNWQENLRNNYIKDVNNRNFAMSKEKGLNTNYFLYESFFEEFDENSMDLDEYIKETTFTDIFQEKKKIIFQLMTLTRALNPNAYELLEKIYDDEELIYLLTIVTDKTYRNSVFYMDDKEGDIKVKDSNSFYKEMPFTKLLEEYRKNKECFFLEIKFIRVKDKGIKK